MPQEKPPHDEPTPAETEIENSGDGGTARKSNLPPGVILAFVIIALLGMLIAMVVKSGGFSHAPAENQALSSLQAEYNALHMEYNKERVSMG